MSFPPRVVEDLLVKSARCCCLCRQFKGQKIEIHHIVQEADGGPSTEDNGIPLCFDCHADVQSYNDKHPKGRKYRPDELKRHREQWFIIAAGQGNARLQEMMAEMLTLQQQTIERLSTPDYSGALAAVAVAHGIPANELQELFTAHAGKVAASEYAASLQSARVLLAAGQFSEAEKVATQFAILSRTTVQEAENTLLAARNSQIDAWLTAGIAALQDGRNEVALQLVNNAVALSNQEDDIQLWLDVHRTLVVMLLGSHHNERALEVFLNTVEIRKAHKIGDINREFEDLYNFATILMQYGDLTNAEKMFNGSFNLANQEFSRDDKRLAASLLGLSQIKLEQNSLNVAEDIARKYLGLLQENKRLETREAALGFYNLGKILRLTKDNDKSLEMYQKALAAFHNHLPQHPSIALCVNDMGLLYLQIGKIAKAVSCFTEAIQLVKDAKPCDRLIMSMYVANLGLAFTVLGQSEDAVKHLSEAIEIRTTLLGNEHPQVIELIRLRDVAKRAGNGI